MTTIVVVRKGDRAVVGADTLGTYGDQLESAAFVKNSSKLIEVGDTWMAVTGHAAFDTVLRNIFSQNSFRTSFRSVNDILMTSLEIHKLLKDYYFLRPDEDEEDSFESSRMHILLANPYGIFGVCAKRTVFEYSKFYAFGSGEQYALGAMQAVYESIESPEEVARVGLEAAITFDSGTGAPIELKTVKLKAALRD